MKPMQAPRFFTEPVDGLTNELPILISAIVIFSQYIVTYSTNSVLSALSLSLLVNIQF